MKRSRTCSTAGEFLDHRRDHRPGDDQELGGDDGADRRAPRLIGEKSDLAEKCSLAQARHLLGIADQHRHLARGDDVERVGRVAAAEEDLAGREPAELDALDQAAQARLVEGREEGRARKDGARGSRRRWARPR
jgi:hypothetical protein